MTVGKRTALLSAFFFVSAALAFWFVFGIVPTPVKYVSVAADLDPVSPFDYIRPASRFAFRGSVEALVVFLSGLSFFPAAGSSVILTFRGACLGATLRAIRDGAVIIQGYTAVPGMSSAAAVILLYAVTSLLFIAFSFAAASFSERFRIRGSGRAKSVLFYSAVFTVFLGAVTALDLLRCAAVS